MLKKRKQVLKAKKVLYMYVKLKKPKFRFRFWNVSKFKFFWRLNFMS